MDESDGKSAAFSFSDAVDVAFEMLGEITELSDEADKLAAFVFHYCALGDDKSLSEVITAANSQALSYDALTLTAATFITRDMSFPRLLKEWTSQALTGLISRPPVPTRFAAGWPGYQEQRDLLIYDLVVELRSYGIRPTRNTTTGRVSGCDAVADAMILRRQRPCSYSGVRDCYYKVKNCLERGSNPRLPVSILNQLILEMRG